MKMRVIYTPEGASRSEWVIDLANPAWDLSFATEKATGWPWGVFRDKIGDQSAIALRALLWVLRKRTEPRLAIESVVPNLDELDFEAQCPKCESWLTTEDDEHKCPVPEGDEADDPSEDPSGEA